jgi:GNAT superfamily N-acetyltransferase
VLQIDQPPLEAALEAARTRAPRDVSFRRWASPADYGAMLEVFRAAREADGCGWEITAESLDADLRALGSRPEDATILAEMDGVVVGWVRAFDFGLSPDEGRLLMHSGHVHPAARRHGIGGALLEAAHVELQRLRDARHDPTGTTAGFHAWVFARNASGSAFHRRNGYRPLRYVVEMTRSLDAIEEVPLPVGLTTRAVEPADRLPILRAMDQAMHDHRGWPTLTEEQLLGMFEHPTRGQTDIWQVAWDGDRVVGGVLGFIDADENAAMGRKRGYTEGIFTVGDWRGRGVASALIARNLRLLRERGMTEAALSVDTESPTGALGLYERHGFREEEQVIIFRRDLPPAP